MWLQCFYRNRCTKDTFQEKNPNVNNLAPVAIDCRSNEKASTSASCSTDVESNGQGTKLKVFPFSFNFTF